MKTNDDKTLAALVLKTRLVARLLGGEHSRDDRYGVGVSIKIGPRLALTAASYYGGAGRLSWSARYLGESRTDSLRESITLDGSRPAAAIVADLKRRLIPQARAFALAAAKNEAADLEKRRTQDAELAQLEAIIGPTKEYQHGYKAQRHASGFCVNTSDLGGHGHRGVYSAEITVSSFHCLLMIAKLVAEDHRLATLNQPKEQEAA